MTRACWIIAAVMMLCTVPQRVPAQDAPSADDALSAITSALTQLDQLSALNVTDADRALHLRDDGHAAAERSAAGDFPPAVRCQFDFLRAELNRRAALVLSDDHEQRVPLLQQALEQYRKLRVDHRNLLAGLLGYAGEARVHRALGQYEQADAALAPVLIDLSDARLARQPLGMLAVQRLLWLERLETALKRDAAEGDALAKRLGDSTLMKDAAPAERAAMRFAVLQSRVQRGGGDAEQLARELRDEAIVNTIPQHQWLALLMKLHEQRQIALSADEHAAWARLQAWAGQTDAAVQAYAAAGQAGEMEPADWQAYGSLLYGLGRRAEAADVLDRALASAPADSPARLQLLQAIAAGRLEAAQREDADDQTRSAAAEALWQLVEAADDASVRRDALRSWAHLQQHGGTLDQQLDRLTPYRDDVAADPYLALLAAQARWRTADESQRATIAQELRDALEPQIAQAPPELAAAMVMLLVQTAAQQSGPRAGLDVLARHERSLSTDAPDTPQIMGLKLQLLMQLGLAAEAETLARQLSEEALSSAAGMQLARMLAARYAEAADANDQRAQLRERVAQLTGRALAQHRDVDYRATAIEAARLLIRVQAYAQAQHVLEGATSAGAADDDVEVALLRAEALRGAGDLEGARGLLDRLSRTHAQSGEVHLATAQLQHQLAQWPAAAAAYREARKHLAAGSEPWWTATVGLGETLVEQGHPSAAAELLRVASALYRSSAPAPLLPKIDQLVRQSTRSTGL